MVCDNTNDTPISKFNCRPLYVAFCMALIKGPGTRSRNLWYGICIPRMRELFLPVFRITQLWHSRQVTQFWNHSFGKKLQSFFSPRAFQHLWWETMIITVHRVYHLGLSQLWQVMLELWIQLIVWCEKLLCGGSHDHVVRQKYWYVVRSVSLLFYFGSKSFSDLRLLDETTRKSNIHIRVLFSVWKHLI